MRFGVVRNNNLQVVASRNTDFTLSLGSSETWVDIPCNVTILNRNNVYNTSNFNFTASRAGIYRITCHVTLITSGGTPPSTLRVAAGYLLNTVDNFLSCNENSANYAGTSYITYRNLSVGDIVRPRVFYRSGGGSGFTLTLMGANNSPMFSVERMT